MPRFTGSNIKQSVAGQLGKTDYATPVTNRDVAINDARTQFYSAHTWSFCRALDSITITASEGPLPDTFNSSREPTSVFATIDGSKQSFIRVDLDDFQYLDTDSDYYYAIDTEDWTININRTDVATLQMWHYQVPTPLPLSGSGDSGYELCSDPTAIIRLSIALYWLNTERDEGKFQIFMESEYNPLLNKLIFEDKKLSKKRDTYEMMNFGDLGWNKRSRSYLM